MLQNMHALQASHMLEVDCTIDLQNLSQVGSGMVFFFFSPHGLGIY